MFTWIRKLFPIFLSISMMITVVPVTALDAQFTDMPANWATSSLKNAVANGLLFGNEGKIMPNMPLTRAQMAAMVNRAFGATAKASLAGYADVPANVWYFDDMAKAVQMKTFVGDGKQLKPNARITREEAFTVLARAFKISGAPQAGLNTYTDGALVSQWARDSMATLAAYGIITGSKGKLNPGKNVTRAEIARTFDNLITQYIREAGTYEQDINENVMIAVSGVTLKNMKITGTLVIGDGVGNGDVTLDGVEVTDGMIVRGGGVNSVKIVGKSVIPIIIVARVEGKVRLLSGEGAQIGEVLVDGRDDVILEGNVESLNVLAAGVTVTTVKASIAMVTITGANARMAVTAGTSIKKMALSSDRAGVTVSSGAEILDIAANGIGAVIDGPGDVWKVTVNGNNTTVTTPGTEVVAAAGVTGTIAGNITLKEEAIPLNPPVVGSIGGGGSGGGNTGGGGSGGGGSGGGTPSVPLTSIAAINGVAREDETVVAGVVTPSGAVVSYQWKISDTVSGIYTNIPGATAKSYQIAKGYAGKFLKVSATGVGLYSGTVISPATSAIFANAEDITAAAIRMTAPKPGEMPQDTDAVDLATRDPDFTVSELTWHGALMPSGKFKADQAYSATLVLVSDNLKEFQKAAFTPTITGAKSVGTTTTTGRDVGNEVSFTVSFPTTAALTVASIAVTTQPLKMEYTVSADPALADDVLALDGMVVTETYNDGSTVDYHFPDEAAEVFTTLPANGTILGAANNGTPVTITQTATGFKTTTEKLIVKVDPPDITGAAITMNTPVVGETPDSSAVVEAATSNADYTVTNVVWKEELTPDGRFKAGQAYSAAITLVSKNGKEFRTATFTPVVVGSESVTGSSITGSGSGNTLTFTVIFVNTDPLAITGIAVTTQPDEMTYVVDSVSKTAILVLDGMVVTATFNDGSTQAFAFPEATTDGFVTSPLDETILDITFNGTRVTITYGSTLRAETDILTVTE